MDSTEKFARALHGRLNQEAAEWVGLIDTTPAQKMTDPYFKSVSELYHSLDENQRRTFLALVQQCNVDGAASLLAVIDGCSPMEDWRDEFGLTYEGMDLSPDLLDIFLGIDQQVAPAVGN